MSIDQFKEFVSRYPKLKDEVIENKTTWQKLYENWKILGENDSSWDKYKVVDEVKEKVKEEVKDDRVEDLKGVINYLKKLDVDKVSKHLNSAQKIMNLIQGFIGGKGAGAVGKMTGDPLFDKKFDDWY